LRTSKTHAQGQTRTQASAHAKKITVGLRRFQVIDFRLPAKNQTPMSPSKTWMLPNNRPKPIAGCQKPIHNVKEPKSKNQSRRTKAISRQPSAFSSPPHRGDAKTTKSPPPQPPRSAESRPLKADR